MKKAEEAIPTAIYDTEKADQELQAQYGMSDANFKPAFLYVERGPGAGQLLEVKQGTVVIGRASVSDLRLQHPSISRRHAQVRRVGEQFFVKDLGSQNGSFVNKTRIASEVEVKIGDTLALGNALLRLRGPMQKGEKPPASQSGKARVPTAVVARPQYSTGQLKAVNSSRMVKIAVFAGAVGFGLAAVLAFALIRMATGTTPVASTTAKDTRAASAEPNDAIAEALKKKQAVAVVAPVRAAPAPAPEAASDEPTIDEGSTTVTRSAGAAPTVAPAKIAPAVNRLAAATRRVAVPSKADEGEDEAPKGGAKRTQILAPYERGNAEGSLELARSAGDKELAGQLTSFITAYDNGQEALLSNNGTVAIKEFTKALAVDEKLSSGWGKYSGEIRKHLGNLYFLVGKQYEANGDDDKAKSAYAAALKHDPSNSKAKNALGAAASGGGDEEAPAPKPAPKKAPSKTSIDDAFGD
ncbi:MAG: FHA domain-containing protein [Myxococcaceae bacterium]|nr:FHA domain-containing protein [Myxococcaceae bacterium]